MTQTTTLDESFHFPTKAEMIMKKYDIKLNQLMIDLATKTLGEMSTIEVAINPKVWDENVVRKSLTFELLKSRENLLNHNVILEHLCQKHDEWLRLTVEQQVDQLQLIVEVIDIVHELKNISTVIRTAEKHGLNKVVETTLSMREEIIQSFYVVESRIIDPSYPAAYYKDDLGKILLNSNWRVVDNYIS